MSSGERHREKQLTTIVTLFGSQSPQTRGEPVVLLHAVDAASDIVIAIVNHADVCHRAGVAHVGRESEQPHRLGNIPRCAGTHAVQVGQRLMRGWASARDRFVEQLHRLRAGGRST